MKNISLIIVLLLLSVIFTSCLHSYIERNKKVGNTIIEKIELYKNANSVGIFISVETITINIQKNSNLVKKMKVQYLSDIHLEFADNCSYFRHKPIKPVGDIIIIAGDCFYLDRLTNKPCQFMPSPVK